MSGGVDTRKFVLHQAPTEELLGVLRRAMKENFVNCDVQEQECPDLEAAPWLLSAQGICGSPTLVDIGDAANLQKPELHHTTFELPEVATTCGFDPAESSFLGAGAVALHVTGKNG